MRRTVYIGTREISLPLHMYPLPQGSIDIISRWIDAASRVVAAGVDPGDGSLYLVTATGEVRVVPLGPRIRIVSAYPSHDGSRIGLTLMGDSASLHDVISIDTISKSQNCILGDMKLEVSNSYVCDVRFEEPGRGPEDVRP